MLRHLCTNSSLMDMFPNLSKLATIAALVPVSTAECERSFSAMNRIKTELRNRLKTTTLSCLMRISIEGPSVSDFDYERANSATHLLGNVQLEPYYKLTDKLPRL